jgi:TolB-like protein
LSAERRPLTDLATSIADGTPVDWQQAEQAADPHERRVIRHLRLVANVAELYRSLPAEPSLQAPAEPGADGPTWGHLVLREALGRGTSGEVHRAWDTELHREVALKLFPPDPKMTPHVRASVLAEARRLARVRHPNVATVYGADVNQDRIGFWMELVHGASLQDVVERDGPLGAREAAGIGIELCAALAAVHGAGLLHRDVKAQNVLRETGGRIVLTDFGTGEEAGATFTRMAGTPMYLAPEILAGKPASAQTDLYSLGVLLFYLVTREFPVSAKTMPDLMRAHKSGAVRHLRDVRPDLPAAFVEVVERLLATDPAARFQTAGEAEIALRRASGPSDVLTTNVTGPAPGAGRRWVFATAAAALLVVTAALIVWGMRPSGWGAASGATRIAVMPMRTIDPTTAPPFFAEGLTDQLIATLGQIASLRISSAPAGGDGGASATIPEGTADAILETTLLAAPGGDGSQPRIRVNARLVSAGGGPLLWTNSFERPLGDSFSIQALMAGEIAAAVNAAVTPEEASRLAPDTRQTTPQAAVAFLEGRAYIERYGVENWRRAEAAFSRAIQADANHAGAHAGLARALFTLGHGDEIPQAQARARALRHAEQAIALDPALPEAHATLGDLAFYYDWNWLAAEERYRTSVEINPSFIYGRLQFAQLLAAARRTGEAVAQAQIAVDLQPSSPEAWRWLALMRYYDRDLSGAADALTTERTLGAETSGYWILSGRIAEAAGRIEQARDQTDRAIALSPGVPGLLRVQRIRLMALGGDAAGARTALEAMRREFAERNQPWNPQFDAYVHLAAGDHEQALDGFEAALAQRHWSLLWIGVDPRLDPLRDHPRFTTLLRGLGAP